MSLLRRRRVQSGPVRARSHDRKTWSVPLEMWELERSSKGGWRERKLDVTTADISVGGMAFYYRQYIHPGSAVRARFDTLPGRPTLTAIVRNCTLVSANQHRVGVEFVEIKREGQEPPTESRPMEAPSN